MTMQGRVQQLLLCMSVAALLAMPCCNAAPSTAWRAEPLGPRSVMSSNSAAEDDTEVRRNDPDQEAPPSAMERENQVKWASFHVQEVAIDYNPAAANPDPGNAFPIGD